MFGVIRNNGKPITVSESVDYGRSYNAFVSVLLLNSKSIDVLITKLRFVKTFEQEYSFLSIETKMENVGTGFDGSIVLL